MLEYFAGFDIIVHEAYGQSETSGLLCANIPKRYCKPGTTGKVCVVADTFKAQWEFLLLQMLMYTLFEYYIDHVYSERI